MRQHANNQIGSGERTSSLRTLTATGVLIAAFALTTNFAAHSQTAGTETQKDTKQTISKSAKRGASPEKEKKTMQTAPVTINGVRLEEADLARMQKQYGCKIPAGDYWYDKRCGAWGVTGGPTLGFTLANVNVGGPLKSDASRGDTGVFVNGRQLHRQDVQALLQLGIPVQRGRVWVDAYGNCGVEGGPMFCNLIQISQSQRKSPTSHTGWYSGGLSVGSDGQTTYFLDPSGSSAIK